jgi:hypothetical protein
VGELAGKLRRIELECTIDRCTMCSICTIAEGSASFIVL